jgi:hypothetical protein
MEEARSLAGLNTNSVVRLRKLSGDGRLRIEIEDFGYAEAILTYCLQTICRHVKLRSVSGLTGRPKCPYYAMVVNREVISSNPVW